MDEASGSALDATAGGRNLANFGNPITSSAGIINTARAFPGSGGASLFASNSSSFSPGSNSFSFSFWVNFSPTAGGDYEGLLAKGVVGPSNVEWLVYRHGDNRLRFSVSPNGSTLTTVTSASTLSTSRTSGSTGSPSPTAHRPKQNRSAAPANKRSRRR